MTSDDRAIIEAMAAELQAHEAPLTLVLRPFVAIQLAGLLQLALRHPAVTREHRVTANLVVAHVRAAFRDCPAILEVLCRGDYE